MPPVKTLSVKSEAVYNSGFCVQEIIIPDKAKKKINLCIATNIKIYFRVTIFIALILEVKTEYCLILQGFL